MSLSRSAARLHALNGTAMGLATGRASGRPTGTGADNGSDWGFLARLTEELEDILI